MTNMTNAIKKTKHAPLQPESTSIPMTCPAQSSQFTARNTPKLSDCIERLMHSTSRQLVQQLVRDSLHHVHADMLAKDPESVAHRLLASVDTLSQNNLLVAFFTLLNVDEKLKSKVLSMESGPKHAKITRFLIDLRSLIVSFFVDTRMSSFTFIQKCEELYVLS